MFVFLLACESWTLTAREKEKTQEKVDRKRGGKTILKSGQGWTLLGQLGQQKTGLGGKGLL